MNLFFRTNSLKKGTLVKSDNLINTALYLADGAREGVGYYYSLIKSHIRALIGTKTSDLQ